MNSVLICEGFTDYILFKYYMKKVYNWQDVQNSSQPLLQYGNNESQFFTCNSNFLTIMSSGGCSHLTSALENVLNRNFNCQPNLSDAITKIAIITDRDEITTEVDFINEINSKLMSYNATPDVTIKNNNWVKIHMNCSAGHSLDFDLLVMVIPSSGTGAMETCLLNAISAVDAYDKKIIDDGNAFVQNADPSTKYLIHRRYVTKAKFHVYFCIRGPIEQIRSQQILMNVPWEQYPQLQNED